MNILCWMKHKISVTAVVFTAAFSLSAEISFENPDINSQNQVVFTVAHSLAGSPSYKTAFLADASKSSGSKILTCFPEKMEVLSSGAILQVRNRYGTARYAINDGTLAWIQRSESVPAESIRLGPQAVSPDGKWMCYVRKTGVATGQLILKNASTFTETLLDEHADFSFEKVPVLWSPDSSTVIYEKNGSIYFCDPKAAFQQVQMTEEFRKIGGGKINAVCWAGSKTLVYVDHDIVYRVNSNELYTRGMYAPMVGSGTVIGRLPLPFDPLTDHLYVNATADRMVVLQGTKFISSYRLTTKGFASLMPEYSKPFTDARGSVISIKLFWAEDNAGILWVDIIGNTDGALRSTVYRLDEKLTQLSVIENPGKPLLSPDGKTIAFSSGDTMYVYDISLWKNLARLPVEKIVSYVWHGNATLYVGSVSAVREWRYSSKEEARIRFLSAANLVYWKKDASIVAQDAVNLAVLYDYDEAHNVWQKSSQTSAGYEPQIKVQNGRYRVFVGSTANQRYKNTLYIRNLTGGVENKALFPATAVKTAAPKKLVLAFDAADSADGLTRILSVLKEYDVPATFFINGEFVRRYPAEAKQVAACGYECASMFFTNADLTGKGFVVDDDFIRRGLARNEDEFYAATGKELSLFWHAPFYRVTAEMRKAANASGYRYVDCGKWSLDTQTFEEALKNKENYLTASEIISYYAANARDMTIIPVITGISKGSRSDYLYDKLDLLISALWDAGYEIVPIRLFI